MSAVEQINYASIQYPSNSILLALDKEYSLEPITEVIENPLFPDYCEGLGTVIGNPTLIIDFAKFLRIDDADGEHILLYNRLSNNEYYALKIPIPKIIKYDNYSKSKPEITTQRFSLVSTTYTIIENEVFLRIDGDQVFKFIQDEITAVLKESWSKITFKWEKLVPIVTKNEVSLIGRVKKQDLIFKETNYLIAFRLGEYNFSFEEKYFDELIPLSQVRTRIPHSSECTEGIINFKGENIPILDLAKIFGLEIDRTNNLLTIILKIDNGRLGILLDNETFRKVDASEFLLVNENNIDDLLINNIRISNNEILYNINLNNLALWINSPQIFTNKKWMELFTVSKLFYNNQTFIEKEMNIFNNHIAIKVPDYTFVVELASILQIRGRDTRKEILMDGITFVNYMDKWIPSIEIFDELENPLSIIIQSGKLIVEVISNFAYFEDVNDEILSEDMINHLYTHENYYAVKKAYIVNDGIAFDFNLKNLAENVLNIDIKKLNKIQKTIKDPIPQVEEEIDSMLRIWQENIDLVLLLTDSLNNKKAIKINNIKNVLLETEDEFIPWEETKEERYIYLSIQDGKKELVYQVPVNCQLRGVPKDENTTEVILDDEPVKIIELKK